MSMICRDELQSIKDSIECCLLQQVRKGDVDIDALETWCKAVVKRINAALATPRRNCDKYPDFNDAITVLAKKRGWTGTRWNSERYCILANWLLATEEKGRKNGR